MNYEFTRLSDVNIADKINDLSHVLVEKNGEIVRVSADMFSSKEEVQALLSVIPKFAISAVDELPTEDISETTVYLLASGEDGNLYTEYIYVNGAWEILGEQKVDLTGYLKETDVEAVAISGEWDDLEGKPFGEEETFAHQFTKSVTKEAYVWGTDVSSENPEYRLYPNTKYLVKHDGTEYRCETGESSYLYIGCFGDNVEASDEYPFHIWYDYEGDYTKIYVVDDGVAHTVELYKIETVINAISDEYIPDTIARTDDVSEQIAEAIAGVPEHTWESLPDKPFGYINGMYAVYPFTETYIEGSVPGYSGFWYLMKTSNLIASGAYEGNTVRVLFDGAEYAGVLAAATLMDEDRLAFGNLSVVNPELPDTGEPFCIYLYACDSTIAIASPDGSDQHAFAIWLNVNGNAQIEEELIPYTIARVANIPEPFSGEWDDLEGKPFGIQIEENDIIPRENFDVTLISAADPAYYRISPTLYTYELDSANENQYITIESDNVNGVYPLVYRGVVDSSGTPIYAYGNVSIENADLEDTGEPFMIRVVEGYVQYIDFKDNPGDTVTIHVYTQNEVINTIPDEYISETVRNQHVQGDWNQNDPEAADYVKNRTHYEGVVEKELYKYWREITNLTYVDNTEGMGNPINNHIGEQVIIYVGNSDTKRRYIGVVSQDGEWVEVDAYWQDDESVTMQIRLNPISGSIYFYLKDPNINLPTNVAVFTAEEQIHPLPEKFLPTTVPVIQTATVGQTIVVKAVDADGKPTEWEAVDAPAGYTMLSAEPTREEFIQYAKEHAKICWVEDKVKYKADELNGGLINSTGGFYLRTVYCDRYMIETDTCETTTYKLRLSNVYYISNYDTIATITLTEEEAVEIYNAWRVLAGYDD